MRGTNGRPTTEQVTADPQAARENIIKGIFREQAKFLARLFPKDGDVMVNRCVSSAIQALRMRDKKTGELALGNVAPEVIAERCIQCHHMGLEPITEAYLVPYGKDITIIKSPQGLIKLMFNAGWRVEARAVREGDFFDHELGPEGFIKHRKVDGRREGAVTHGYAFARHMSGGPVTLDVQTRDDIESYRAQSKQANGPMWTGNYEGAVRKTMIHRIAEFLPLPASLMASLRGEESGAEVTDEIRDLLREMNRRTEPVTEEPQDRQTVFLPPEPPPAREPGED